MVRPLTNKQIIALVEAAQLEGSDITFYPDGWTDWDDDREEKVKEILSKNGR